MGLVDSKFRALPDCFYDDFVYEFLREGGEDIIIENDKRQLIWQELMKEVDRTSYEGVVLESADGDQWVILSPEPYSNGGREQFRYTVFDRYGFCSHETFNSKHEALVGAFDSGYVTLCPDNTLDLIARGWGNSQPFSNKG